MHIPRLTLHGIPLDPRHERRVRSAAEAELASLLAGAPLPMRLQAGGMARRLPGTELRIGSWADPADLGREVARAVYEGLGR